MSNIKKSILVFSLVILTSSIFGGSNIIEDTKAKQSLFQNSIKHKQLRNLALCTTILGATGLIVLHGDNYKNISAKFNEIMKSKFDGRKSAELKKYAKLTAVGTLGAGTAILAYNNLNTIGEFSYNNRETFYKIMKQIRSTLSTKQKPAFSIDTPSFKMKIS